MISRLFYLAMALFLFVCCNDEKNNIQEIAIKKGDTLLKGTYFGDTLLHGEVSYFSSDGLNLLGTQMYKFGKLEGPAIELYENGNKRQLTYYSNGLKNGKNRYFDNSGHLFYENYYYYNLVVGPITFYDSIGNPRKFYFSNLQNEDLLIIDYKDWKGVSESCKNCISFTKSFSKRDSVSQIDLLIYLMNPPKLSFSYSLVKKEILQSDDQYIEIMKLSDPSPFLNITLNAPLKSEIYSVKLFVYDSLKDKRTVIYQDL